MGNNELLQKLLKRITLCIKLIGFSYFIGYLGSSYIALKMYLYKDCSNVTLTWQYPTRNLTLVFVIWLFLYVIVSQFWRYMFFKIVNEDDVLIIKKLFKLWWIRLIYPVLLGIFIVLSKMKVSDYGGGTSFWLLIAILLGIQAVAFIVYEVLFQITYRRIEAL